MRIAVVGSGISGMASAWLLSQDHEVTLYEAGSHVGGHTHTHDVHQDGVHYAVDSGFIVFNGEHYPLLTALFARLGVASQPTTMSFAVQNGGTGLEYNAASLDGLFCQRRNLLSPRFLGMVRDLLRFYREAPALLGQPQDTQSLGQYLAQRGYGAAFRDDHLVPMASALWSSPPRQILNFPVRYLVQFMANHQMLRAGTRPQWRVVSGGSQTYVRALRSQWDVDERVGCGVIAVRRHPQAVELRHRFGIENFDQVVMACHSDETLALLDASESERAVLGAIGYQANDVVLHTDARLLPRSRKAWAAWNAYIPAAPDAACTVSYCMNLLQGIESREPFIVTLNRSEAIEPAKVLRRLQYRHPEYSVASVAAQRRKSEIQGQRRTWFAGAYWGWGFHEDGMRSAVDVAEGLGSNAAHRLLGTRAAPAAAVAA
ncbi:MAG: FAD-dependent oxidoreductase [Steroidobacteraceae bacterium]